MPNYIYSDDFKVEVVKFYKSGHTIAETIEKYGVSESTLFVWKSMYESRRFSNSRKPKKNNFSPQMKTHVRKMEQIAEIIKRSPCGATASTDEKMSAIKILSGEYSIRVLCEALNLPRGTYYNRKRREGNPTTYEMNDEAMKPIIKQIFYDADERLGSAPIRAILAEKGYRVNRHRVKRLMKEMGLSVKLPQYAEEHLKSLPNKKYTHKNLLNQNFTPEAPNTVWVSDITYVKVGEGYMFLCVIIDLYARQLLACKISNSIDAVLVIETFDEAYEKRNMPNDLMFHSDQGVQYTSYVFRQRLRELGVTQSFSTPGVPYDNAVCESFFRNMKKEAIYHHLYQNEQELWTVVKEYMHFYNEERPHKALHMKTPVRYESEFYLASCR